MKTCSAPELKASLEQKIDVVIPTTSKDFDLLEKVVIAIRKNVLHAIKNIYIVAPENQEISDFCTKNDCVFINEDTVLDHPKGDTRGWVFQQQIKLGANAFVMQKYFLVVDGDTVLTNSHKFIEGDKLMFFQSSEWHQLYFDTFKKIFGYSKSSSLSHVAHMMIFDVALLEEMKKEIEEKTKKPWKNCITDTFSEYETYSNWMLVHYPHRVIERPFYNKALRRGKMASGYNSLSFHSYIE